MSSLNIQQNIPLAPYTTFKIGGPAKFFVEVGSEEELAEALKYAKDNSLEFFILGGGSNILINDQGFNGLVIKFKVQSEKLKVTVQNSNFLIECWAGDSLAEVVNFSTENSLTGLEWAAGIPGIVGGAVRGNAGMPGGCMADSVENVKVLEIDEQNQNSKIKNQNCNSKLKIIDNKNCKFGYRTSLFKENHNLIIVFVMLKLQKGDKSEIEAKIKKNLEKRTKSQPLGFSPGSFFKNPVVTNERIIAEFEKDTGVKVKDNKNLYQNSNEIKIPAGWLIAEAGLLGRRVGNIQVSENHGNFVINLGDGKAQDAIILLSIIKQKVRMKFCVQLVEEVQFVGF